MAAGPTEFIVTLVVVIIIVVIYFSINKTRFSNRIIDNAAAATYHANMNHLLSNMFSFVLLSPMESRLGAPLFICIILFIWLLSTLILTVIQLAIPRFDRYSLGFSGVVIGLMVVYTFLIYKDGNSKFVNLGFLLASILPQLFMTGISVEGHISGFIAGIAAVFCFGLNKSSK